MIYRNCPKCDAKISYTSTRSLANANRRKSLCAECRSIAQRKYNDDYICPNCGKSIVFLCRASLYRARSKKSVCRSCASSLKATKAWRDPFYRQSVVDNSTNPSSDLIKFLSQNSTIQWNKPEYQKAVSEGMKCRWKSISHRAKMTLIYESQEYKQMASERSKILWLNQEYREKVTKSCKLAASGDDAIERSRSAAIKQWQNAEFRQHMAITLAKQPKVSNIQLSLYSMLDDLGVKYYCERNNGIDDLECIIGPYHFDCVIPLEFNKKLLIECQGDYWHSLPQSRRRDAAKASYILNNFPSHTLKYIWEHEFYNHQKVIQLLKSWLGVDQCVYEYDFDDLDVRPSMASDYKSLLLKYHYLPTAGRGGKAIGAYFDDELIAVVVFSHPIRQNVSADLEISRLCVHPAYRKHNLVSWFLSRALRLVQYNRVVAYADQTFNHDGTCYKASGFVLDGITQPDYWYTNGSGWVMHKKTLYNRAIGLKMKESEYAKTYGYHKIYGGAKLRYVKINNKTAHKIRS